LSDVFLSRRQAVAALSASAALPLVSACSRALGAEAVATSPLPAAPAPSTIAEASAILDSIAENLLRLSPEGIFQAGIPAEGGFTWGLAWRTTTGISYRLRTGLSYAPVMRHEHLNNAAEIIAIIRYFFQDVRVRWHPLPARHLAFYGYIEARTPRLDRCREL